MLYNQVSVNEALEGLVLPAAAYVMLGKTGAVLVLVSADHIRMQIERDTDI